MFEKTQKAAVDLSAAATEETSQAVSMVKAMVVPAVANVFGSLAGYANKIKAGVESGEFVAKAKEAVQSATTTATDGGPVETSADPLPTEAQNVMIKAMRNAQVSDEQIAASLDISVRTVKMAW